MRYLRIAVPSQLIFGLITTVDCRKDLPASSSSSAFIITIIGITYFLDHANGEAVPVFSFHNAFNFENPVLLVFIYYIVREGSYSVLSL